MNAGGVSATITLLLAAEPQVADRDELTVIVRRSREVQSWLDSVNVACARRTRELASEGRAEPAASLLDDGGQRSSKDAVVITQRTVACDAMPAFEAALAAGLIAAGHVDIVARLLGKLDDQLRLEFVERQGWLLDRAQRERIEVFEITCRNEIRRLVAERDATLGGDTEGAELERQRAASALKQWVDKQTGMHHTHVELDPVRGAKLSKAIRDHLRRARSRDTNAGVPWAQLEVDSFINAVQAGVTRASHPSATDAPGLVPERAPGAAADVVEPSAEMRVPEVGVLIDHATLVDAWHEHSVCETYDGFPVPVSAVRRLCCDAEIIPYVLNGNGEVTDLGRSQRTVSRAQRRRLRAMHRTCGGDSACTVPFEQCEIHHVVFWRFRGRTDIENLLPLCSRHHHQAHEGGWTLTMTPHRVVTWTRPDGTVHSTGSSIDRAPAGVSPPDRRRSRSTRRSAGE